MTDPFPPLPACIRAHVEALWREVAPRAVTLAGREASVARLFGCSDFAAALCARLPEVLVGLAESGDLDRRLSRDELMTRLAPLSDAADEPGLKRLARQFRQREFLRLAWRDLNAEVELNEVMEGLSNFADGVIDGALGWLYRAALQEWGVPRAASSGAPQQLVVLGLGKLGGDELNFSSDVDLMFAYDEEGETSGGRRGQLSNQEFFLRLGRALIGVLSEATEDGFVFRVDMRLRPNGNSGPLALSFDAMEHYYQTHGREWERYALIKARVVAGDRTGGAGLLARLKPFVFRKYIDFGALEAIRDLKVSIEHEVARKGIEDNIKLGAGGIREIEFIGQAQQLVRGGRDPAFQRRGIRSALALARDRGYLPAQPAADLDAAYVFLRRLEHRLQMLADRQTHSLPSDPCERARIAYAMGFPDWGACAQTLAHHRRRVREQFDQAFVSPQGERAASDALSSVWLQTADEPSSARALHAVGFAEADVVPARALLAGLHAGAAYASFSSQGRARMDRLMPLLLGAAGRAPHPLQTLERLVRLLEAIGRRSAYLALLVENPMALSQLVKLCAASGWIADWISLHPVLLDELLDPAALYVPLARGQLEDELRERLAELPEDDLEARMEALREFRHSHVLRVAAADIATDVSPEQVRIHLCDIAEVTVAESLVLAQRDLIRKHGRPGGLRDEGMGFAVIAYGKLGSWELGYASDLDLIFLFDTGADGGMTDGARPVPNELFFARLGQRLIHVLTARTPAGILYPVDMRLRPSGQAGPLVTQIEAFQRYQLQQAWVWEHQALVRARFVAGDARVGQAFAAVRQEVLCRYRDPVALRAEVVQMRARMRDAQPPHDVAVFDLKHDPGGIVDIEFMVQYAVLRWAADHPALIRHTDNIRILGALADAGLMPLSHTQVLVDAYRRYLSLEQRLKLMEHRPHVARTEVGSDPERVTAIWRAYFEEEK